MTADLHRDLKLLDILEALPCAEEANTQGLRQRLSELCQAQSVEESPERIADAVDQYTGNRPVVQVFTPWNRPSSRTAWESLRAAFQSYEERRDALCKRMEVTMIGLCAVTSLCVGVWAGLSSLNFMPVMIGVMGGVMAAAVFMPVTLVSFFVGSAFVFPRLKKSQQAQAHVTPWVRTDTPRSPVEQMSEAKRDVERLTRWLTAPAAVVALRELSRGEVPITERDAFELDLLVKADHKARAHQAERAKDAVWQECLDQLAHGPQVTA